MKKKMIAMLLSLTLVLGLMMVPVQAMEIPEGAPEGIIDVFKVAVDGNTRNEDWKDAETGIITLPQGTEFDNGNTNHGVYWLYTDVEPDQVFYVYWVINVEENEDLGADIILAQDPSWLESYGPNAGENEKELSVPIADAFLMDEFDSYELYYDETTPGQWEIFAGGFEVINDATTAVQNRLHYKNLTGVQVKYLIVTSEPMDFVVDPETGEIDGVTNSNPIATPAPATETPEATPTPEATEAPATEAPATEAPATTAPATTAPAATDAGTQSDDGGSSVGLIIGIVAAVVVIAVIVVVVVKKKK